MINVLVNSDVARNVKSVIGGCGADADLRTANNQYAAATGHKPNIVVIAEVYISILLGIVFIVDIPSIDTASGKLVAHTTLSRNLKTKRVGTPKDTHPNYYLGRDF
jgi:hypothetical protein